MDETPNSRLPYADDDSADFVRVTCPVCGRYTLVTRDIADDATAVSDNCQWRLYENHRKPDS